MFLKKTLPEGESDTFNDKSFNMLKFVKSLFCIKKDYTVKNSILEDVQSGSKTDE